MHRPRVDGAHVGVRQPWRGSRRGSGGRSGGASGGGQGCHSQALARPVRRNANHATKRDG
eukprot:8149273-Pyramimonas_sp.AAC.1